MVIIKKAAPGVSERTLTRFIQRARKAAGLRGQVDVLLASSRNLRVLNRRFRGKGQPTDVLSFPPISAVAREFSGDIVVSADIAARNARLYRHTPAQEVKILILHGMLHLAGYDHESDHGRMARKEERLRRELGLSSGLIRRTERVAHAPSRVQSRRKRPLSLVGLESRTLSAVGRRPKPAPSEAEGTVGHRRRIR
ncbi:MAG: rRNA maturation RNase YbeY [Acidobacteriia bacterium]|nr:rRNA maturation RNase YbeY [Terriglobia bacterium]